MRSRGGSFCCSDGSSSFYFDNPLIADRKSERPPRCSLRSV
jgi:hypothetical protein